ncbi:MAG: lysophospholipid acyltransferase family protein [Bacteroidales bacterium]
MIKARHLWIYLSFFRLYSRLMIHRHFRNVTIKGDIPERGMPVLLIMNHFSWWDGFFADYLNGKIFHRKFHVMMLEEQLKKRMFLNKAGVYSIRQHSRSVMDSLQYTRQLLKDPSNLVTVYPQGKIRSMFHYPLRFEKGITKIVSGLENKVQIVFVTTLVDYFSHRKPALTFGLKEYHPGGNLTLKDMESSFNEHMQEMINQQKE